MSGFDRIMYFAGRTVEFLHRREKKTYELKYWRKKSNAEGGQFRHSHYAQFYTTVFGLTESDFDHKRILDIGCGPRGSLEWADMALERIGLDPLAYDYVKLRAEPHKMSYVAGASEHIPFADAHFDIVSSFNSLDHVDDLKRTISEIKRIARCDGIFLLIVEINHPRTPTEPLTLRRDSLELFMPEFRVDALSTCALTPGLHDVYGSVLAGKRPNSDDDCDPLRSADPAMNERE